MTKHSSYWKTCLGGAVTFSLCAAIHLQAQFVPGGGGFPFGGAGAANRQTSTRTTRNYSGNGTVGDAVISIDPVTRNLIVIADEPTKAYISQVISNLDRPKPQVLIKVVFLEVTHNNSLDIGLEGAWGKDIGNSMTGAVAHSFGLSSINQAVTTNPAVNIFGQPIQSFNALSPITSPGAGLYQIFSTDYQVTLRAIAQAGKAKVLSRPSIVARNNQPATILVGQSVPLITSVRYDSLGNAINGITYTDVGIILRVTPFITADGLIEMILSPEISSVSTQTTPLSSGPAGVTTAPFIDKRSADTVVVTPDGQTVIIGGLIADSKAEAETKIPLLGDLPLLGNFFKRKVKTDDKTELLIFLTPQIIQAPTQYASVSAREGDKSGVPRALTEQELNEFLEKLPVKHGSGAQNNGKGTTPNGSLP